MIGYQEVLIDFFYVWQMVMLIYLYIGNIGMIDQDDEVYKVWLVGLIVCDVLCCLSNWCSQVLLQDWLLQCGVVVIFGIDMCKLMCILCECGVQNGVLMVGDDINVDVVLEVVCKFLGLKGMDLVKVISISKVYSWNEGQFDLDFNMFVSVVFQYKVVVYDFGVKFNILCMLVECGCDIIVVLVQILVVEVLVMNFDGVFLFNGLGDLELCDYVIEVIKVFLDKKVLVFGICFGYQLLVLVFGVKIIKMGYGYYGVNYLVQDLDDGWVMIILQNYGFVVDEVLLLVILCVIYWLLFDGINQGIVCIDVLVFLFQGYFEVLLGLYDVVLLFDCFVILMVQVKV